MNSNETTGGSTAVLSTAELERRRLRSALISLAAQMATRQGMPEPDDWPGWTARVPGKLYRAAVTDCEKASNQCADWAYELRKIADAL
jgi:hypothetical protein